MPRGFNSQGVYLKAGLDGVLKSLPVLKISAQDPVGRTHMAQRIGIRVLCLCKEKSHVDRALSEGSARF